MSRFRSLLRAILPSLLTLALASVPVTRVFAASLSFRRAATISAPGAGGSASHAFVRTPRLRRPKQSALIVLPERGRGLPRAAVARRSVPVRERSSYVEPHVTLPDHPPA